MLVNTQSGVEDQGMKDHQNAASVSPEIFGGTRPTKTVWYLSGSLLIKLVNFSLFDRQYNFLLVQTCEHQAKVMNN